MKVKTSKGFTLAELLIVMGIITILAAIAIPTFGKQLETARETADEQAIRAALEDAFNTAFTDYATTGALSNSGKYVEAVEITQTKAAFSNITPVFNVGGGKVTAGSETNPASTDKFVQFTFAEKATNDGIELKDIGFAATETSETWTTIKAG